MSNKTLYKISRSLLKSLSDFEALTTAGKLLPVLGK